MTIHIAEPTGPVVPLDEGFKVSKTSAGWISIRQDTEGHVFTFFFNSARTALASVSIQAARTARYDPAYFEEAAWRFADLQARAEGLIFARNAA